MTHKKRKKVKNLKCSNFFYEKPGSGAESGFGFNKNLFKSGFSEKRTSSTSKDEIY